ncbi:MAG: metallophosphoesterase family protein [Thermoproteota archaeon]
MDCDTEALKKRYEEVLKAELKGYFVELLIEGISVALIHGVHEPIVRALAKSGEYAVVVHGHTHRARSEVIGNCLVVNPGEACGYVNGVSTVAVLSLPGREVKHVKFK